MKKITASFLKNDTGILTDACIVITRNGLEFHRLPFHYSELGIKKPSHRKIGNSAMFLAAGYLQKTRGLPHPASRQV